MHENEELHPVQVIGPDGEALTRRSLPPMNTRRWVARRKAQVVSAVAGGLLTSDQACRRYSLSPEELASWQRDYELGGMSALRVTRIKDYRQQRHMEERTQEYFNAQAERCREDAAECTGTHEERLLLSLARAFDELASEQELIVKPLRSAA